MNIDDFLVDEVNEAKMARHGVGVDEVLELLAVDEWEAFRNPATKRGGAPRVVVGPTRSGRLLTIPIDATSIPGLWRPRSAFDAGKEQTRRYQRQRGGL